MPPPAANDAAPAEAEGRSLDASLFSYYGFDRQLVFERRARQLAIRDGEPRVAIVDDAIFLPSDEWRGADGRKTYGGVYAADGQRVEFGQLRRKGRLLASRPEQPVAIAPRRELDEEVVFLGPLFNHYGRVLLESLARVWFLSRVEPSVRVVFDDRTHADRAANDSHWRILEQFGIPPDRLLVLDEPTGLRRALVPEPLFEQMHAAHANMVLPFRAVATEVAGDLAPSSQPLYLSRRLLSSRQRPIVGEAELEDVLRENGFLVAYPETMAFADQVRLVNAHTEVFAGIGSAAHTILFARDAPHLHLLTTDDRISANYFLCSALSGVATTFVACLGTGHRPDFSDEREAGAKRSRRGGGAPAGTGPMATPHLVELDRLSAYLTERGFLTKRLRASMAGRDPALRDRYDEAWLFARVRRALPLNGPLLPPEIEDEAVGLATRSWPVSAVLARYVGTRLEDLPRADALARQYLTLVAEEFDVWRLAHYRSDVRDMVARLARLVEPETAERLAAVLADRFLGGLDEAASDPD